ncbi:MAG: SDR family NAD(P)-dependent oxidoreductase, partial [Gemmatimonadota bacterium]
VVVGAAGQAPDWRPIHETSDGEWLRIQDVNLNGPFRLARAALPHMVEAGGGVIVLIGSISAVKASNSVASYAAAKAGLGALTRCIAAEYGWHGVRCNCVVPSWVETPMTRAFLSDPATREDVARRHPLRRVATPDEIARTVLYLASEDAAFVTGEIHAVDGGMSAL